MECLLPVSQAQEKLGPVDMLVNCAGMSISGKFEEVEVDRFKVSNLVYMVKFTELVLTVTKSNV